MRKMLMMILLASSVAMPAIAQDNGESRRDRGTSEQRSEARAAARAERAASRAERAERPQRAERSEEVRIERVRPDRAERAERMEVREWRRRDREAPPAVTVQPQEQPVVQQERDRRSGFRDGSGREQYRGDRDGPRRDGMRDGSRRDGTRDGYREGSRRDGTRDGYQDGSRRNDTRDGYRDGSRDGYRDGSRGAWRGDRNGGNARNWSGQWRNDRNYDWRRHRDRNRSLFRIGNYWDPYGSSYRRFSIGFSLYPSYYRSNYWLDDPWMYRLPPAYGPYRWVRYYNDALLVNVYTGQVADVVYGFFW